LNIYINYASFHFAFDKAKVYAKVTLNEVFWWQQQALAFNGPLWRVSDHRLVLSQMVEQECVMLLERFYRAS